jgi:TonB family protein
MFELPQVQAVIQALGWTLVHFLWQGFVIAGLFWLLTSVTQADNARWRYTSGISIFFLSVLVPLLTFRHYFTQYTSSPVISLEQAQTALIGADPGAIFWVRAGIEAVLPEVVVLWALGVLVLTTRTLMNWLGVRRMTRVGVVPVSQELQDVCERLRDSFAIRKAVLLLQSTRVTVPTVIGWLRPVILLPAGVLTRLPADQLEMVIAHELGHIRRCDYLVNLFQLVVETLLFFHPAVRWMSSRIRQEREHCCDDLVVSHQRQPVLYARALANLELLRGSERNTVALAATGGDLFYRVSRIVQGEMPRSSAGFVQVGLMLTVAAVVSISAHRGLELGRLSTDLSDQHTPVVTQVTSSSQSGLRSAWSQGVAQYSIDRIRRQEQAAAAAEAVTVVNEIVAVQQPERSDTKEQPAKQPEQNPQPPVGHDAEISRLASTEHQPAADAPESEPVATLQPERGQTDDLLTNEFHPGMGSAEGFDPELLALMHNRASTPAISPLRSVAPDYPLKARQKGLEGYVKLEFSLDRKGRVRDVEVVDAYPRDVFDRAARKALKNWRFQVGEELTQNLRLVQTFDFNLEDASIQMLAEKRRCMGVTGNRLCRGAWRNMDIVYVNQPNWMRQIEAGEASGN